MAKKIALFIIGVVLFFGAFLLYQHLTGATFFSARKAPPAQVAGGDEDRPPTFESRRPNGDLEYLLSTKKAIPFKDASGNVVPGEYALTEPNASYYTDDGKMLFIRADRGSVMLDESLASAKASKSGRPVPKEGHLSGNVILIYGPRDTFTDNSFDLKPGQLQVKFEQDLDLNYAEQILTSPGLVHLRSDQMAFDGENLTIAFNRGMKRIELLRIDPPVGSGKNNYMLIKNIGKETLDDNSGSGHAAKPPTPMTQAAPVGETANAGAAPLTSDAETPASTKPAKEKTPPTTYKLSFGSEVTATLGQRILTSDQLFVIFMRGAPGEKQESAAGSDAKKPETQPAVTNAASVATAPAAKPIPVAKADDLEVRWTGPMEMRPTADTDLKLVDSHDVALEAVGTARRPVIVKDPTYVVTAGRLWYHKAEQRFELERNGLGPVMATDTDPLNPSLGTGRLLCEGLSYYRGNNLVQIQGPGNIELPPGLIGRSEQKADKPVVATWEKELDVELASSSKAGDPSKAKQMIRHAVFNGKSDITSSDFHIDSQMLDVLVAAADGANAKTGPKAALEHVLATGNVHVKYPHQQGGTIDDAAKPGGINTDRLELLTTKPSGASSPIPASLLARGNVEAWSYAPHRENGKDTGKLDKQTIFTPKLDVELEPKKAAVASAGGGFGKNVQPKTLVASDGVIVELEGFQPETVSASGRTLTVNMNADAGKDSAVAVIDGEGMPDGSIKLAQLVEGANKIGGEHIELDQKNRMITIPGKGQFVFVQPADKGKPATPVQVTSTR